MSALTRIVPPVIVVMQACPRRFSSDAVPATGGSDALHFLHTEADTRRSGIVHHHVLRQDALHPPGLNRFRCWLQSVDDQEPPLKCCRCWWAPELPEHYRVD